MADIFISHSSLDRSAAEEILHQLQANHHTSAFLDFDPEFGIPAGRDWERELYENLRQCQAVVALCSVHSMASKWCFVEVALAKTLGKAVLPVRIDTCAIDPILSRLEVIELADADAIRRLLNGLRTAGVGATREWDRSRTPFPGLFSFDEEDAAVFFGRDSEILAGLEALRVLAQTGPPLLVISGPSGSGKSSLVKAGMLPRLRRDPRNWLLLPVVRTGQKPLRALAWAFLRQFEACGVRYLVDELEMRLSTAQGLAGCADDLRAAANQSQARVLVPIDQLEEILADSHAAGDRFLDLVSASLRVPSSPLLFLATLRSDFLAPFQKIASASGLRYRLLPADPITIDRFPEIVRKPAILAGLECDTDLPWQMANDARTADALPLLAFALRRLYDLCAPERRLREDVYRKEIGGLAGAIQKQAEELTSDLPAAEEQTLFQALLSLVTVAEGGRFLRRPAPWDEIPPAARPLLERFIQGRLLVTRGEGGQRVVEFAHEALLEFWPALKAHLDTAREDLRQLEVLRQAAEEWVSHIRAADDLFVPTAEESVSLNQANDLLVHRGGRLEHLRHILGKSLRPVSEAEQEYVAACIASEEQARAKEASADARLRDARLMQAVEHIDRDSASLVALLREVEDPAAARNWMRYAADALRSPAWSFAPEWLDPVLFSGPIAISRDGSLVAAYGVGVRKSPAELAGWRVGRAGHAVRESPAELVVWRVGRPGHAVRFAIDCPLVWADFDETGSRLYRLSEDGVLIVSLVELGPKPGEAEIEETIEFTEEGYTAYPQQIALRTERAYAELNLDDTDPEDSLVAAGAGRGFEAVIGVSRKGRVLAWSLTTNTPPALRLQLGETVGYPTTLEVSPTGDTAVLFSGEGEHQAARLLRLAPGAGRVENLRGVSAAAFSPDGRFLALASPERIEIVRSENTSRHSALDSDLGSYSLVVFSPDGGMVAAATKSGSIELWPFREGLTGERRMQSDQREQTGEGPLRKTRFIAPPDNPVWRYLTRPIHQIGFGPGNALAVVFGKGEALLLCGPKRTPVTIECGPPIVRCSFSRDGSRMVAHLGERGIRVWTAEWTVDPVAIPCPSSKFANYVQHVEVDADGSVWIQRGPATIGRGPADDAAAEEITEFDYFDLAHIGKSRTLVSDEDLRWLCCQPEGDNAAIFPIRVNPPRDPFLLGGVTAPLRSAGMCADGTKVLGVCGGRLAVWRTDAPAAPAWLDSAEELTTAAFSEDGSLIATGSKDGKLRLWAADALQPVREIGDVEAEIHRLRFAPDSHLLLGAIESGSFFVARSSGGASRPFSAAAARIVRGGESVLAIGADCTLEIKHDLSCTVSGGARLEFGLRPRFISPDGRWFVASRNNEIQLVFSAENLALDPVQLNAGVGVSAYAASADGARLYTGHYDGTVRIWRIDLDPASLKRRLWQATPFCILPIDRNRLLGEYMQEATRRFRMAREEARRYH